MGHAHGPFRVPRPLLLTLACLVLSELRPLTVGSPVDVDVQLRSMIQPHWAPEHIVEARHRLLAATLAACKCPVSTKPAPPPPPPAKGSSSGSSGSLGQCFICQGFNPGPGSYYKGKSCTSAYCSGGTTKYPKTKGVR